MQQQQEQLRQKYNNNKEPKGNVKKDKDGHMMFTKMPTPVITSCSQRLKQKMGKNRILAENFKNSH
jgi:hypothetical protein